jgi:PAS domain S-box-containing protein
MINKSQKLRLNLTIQFAVFFILLSVFVYYVFSSGFEENIYEKFKSKSEIVARYIEQNPQIFSDGKLTDKDELIQLLHLNDAIYFVMLDNNGLLVDGINISEAENNLYLLSEHSKNLSSDGTVYRFHMDVHYGDKSEVGKVFVGYKAGTVTFELKRKTLQTILYSLGILLAGMIVTYLLGLILFRPIIKLYSALDKTDRAEQIDLLSRFKDNEVGSLAQKIYDMVVQLDKSSNEVEILNEKLKDVFREKIYELDVEISHRKKAEIFLKKTEEMFKILFENAPIGMLIVSNDGKVIKSNKAFCNTAGYDELEIIRMNIKNLFEGNSIGGIRSTYQMIMESDSLDLECKLTKRNNRKLIALLKSIKIKDENGEPLNTLLQVLDITEIKKVQGELEMALDKAKESDRLKSAFLAQMSHEIRTPLNVILPSIPILADEIGKKDKELVSILHAVDNAGKRLHRTIDMILSMSAVQSGNYKAKFEKFNLAEDLKNLTQEFTTLCKEKGLEIFYSNNSTSADISADRYTIGQVFQNLIGNAVKYTQHGHVKITVDDYEENKLVVKIEDTGIGMAEKYLKNLFTPFSQEDSGQTRKYEGNGLGLALVKEYVTLNKGQISVQSEKNKGSVFSVVFEKKLIRVTAEDKNLLLNEV